MSSVTPLGGVVADTILSALKTAGNGLSRTGITSLLSRDVPTNQIARALDEMLRRNLANYHKTPSSSGARAADRNMAPDQEG
jgi:hypothetical protein